MKVLKLFANFAKLFVKLFTSFFCKEEPDDVNNFTKSFAHILNFELYWPYYILFNEWRYFFLLFLHFIDIQYHDIHHIILACDDRVFIRVISVTKIMVSFIIYWI